MAHVFRHLLDAAASTGIIKLSASRPRQTIVLSDPASIGAASPATIVQRRSADRLQPTDDRSQKSENSNDEEGSADVSRSSNLLEQPSPNGAGPPYTIDLVREPLGKSLGISIIGGVDFPRGPTGFFVKSVYPNGLVADDGRLQAGSSIDLRLCLVVCVWEIPQAWRRALLWISSVQNDTRFGVIVIIFVLGCF